MTHPLFADLLRSTGGDARAAALLVVAHELRGLASAVRSSRGAGGAKSSDGADAHAVRQTGRGGSKV